jgi:hemerythrin-like domain-containing protein
MRTFRVAPLIDELEAQDVENDRLIEELQQSLIRYETVGAAELPAFGHAVETYAEFHWGHTRKEEEVLIPVAEKSLTEADGQPIGAAFEQNDNPLFGIKLKEQSALLFQRILALAPPPIGFGDQRRR